VCALCPREPTEEEKAKKVEEAEEMKRATELLDGFKRASGLWELNPPNSQWFQLEGLEFPKVKRPGGDWVIDTLGFGGGAVNTQWCG
jgi:hypothetical protein